MASETKVGELVIDLKARVEGLEKGLETARKKLQSIEEQNKQVKSSNGQLDASFIAMSASIVASLVKIKSAIDDGVQKYNSYTNSMRALQKTAKATNNSMVEIEETIDDVNKLKLMDDSDVTAATKNLLTYGFTVKQTGEVLNVLQDAAVGNRQANYTLSEAVRVTTEGIRMENSVLSDAAGVQKNIAKMYEEHAQKIGKTTDSLTQAEKVQAVYNGIMDEATMFTGSAVEMAQGYQGQQAQLNATNLELSRTIGESMIPALTQYSSLQLAITKGLTEFVKNHKTATSGVISFTTTLLAMMVGLTAARKAYLSYKAAAEAANMTTKAFTATLMSNPITIIALGIAGAISGLSMLTTAISENEEATAKLEATTKRYNEIKNGTFTYTDENIAKLESDKAKIEKQIGLMEKEIELQEKINQLENSSVSGSDLTVKNINLATYNAQLKATQKELKKARDEDDSFGNSLAELKNRLATNTDGLREANAIKKIKIALDTETVKAQQKEAAQLKLNVEQMQKYLEVVKKGDSSTTEYQDAVKELAKTYPEAANAEGIIIDLAQDYINAEKAKADEAWNTSQTTIKGNIDVINKFKEMVEAAKDNEVAQKQLAESIGIAYENIIPTLTSVLNILDIMSNVAPGTVAGITPKTSSTKRSTASKGSSSYSNKQLDNYKKEIEHKKALDEISLRDELNMYEYALKHYAKTQDEKWELLEKIHSLQKEIREKTLDDYIADIQYKKAMNQISTQDEINMYKYALDNYAKTSAEKREIRQTIYELNKELAQKEKQLLDEQTKDYENYIQEQKNIRGASYDVVEQSADYDKIIEMHKKYLKQIMQDERLSLEERKQIYKEEVEAIKNYEEQKRNLRVQSIDNTVNQLTQAIKKELDEMYEKDRELIEKNLEEVEKWKNARINAINEEYDARIEAIEKELEALDKAEQQKSREEEDAEYERKKRRLEELIEFEHDSTTKANYQKELDNLVSEHQKVLNKRELEDKKTHLKEQKDVLKSEQDNKIKDIEEESNKRKAEYDKELEKLDKYYNEQISKAKETAEKMLLNPEQNQAKLINLLKSYGDAYELTGQTLGEKLLQGMGKGIEEKIYNFIQKFQDTIDTNIEKKIKEWTSSNYKYEAGKDKPQTKTVHVTQVNHIEQNPELPSELYRKMMNISQSLAQEFAGM